MPGPILYGKGHAGTLPQVMCTYTPVIAPVKLMLKAYVKFIKGRSETQC